MRGQLAGEVERAMAPLTDREREVMRLRYGLGTDREHTLEEVGRRLFITRERVRQIEAKALAKMRAARNRHALRDVRRVTCYVNVLRDTCSNRASGPKTHRRARRGRRGVSSVPDDVSAPAARIGIGDGTRTD
jgi:DNA-binding CsgD family transcriptional regulator